MSSYKAKINALSAEEKVALRKAQKTFDDLKKDFLSLLATNHFVQSNELDQDAAELLPVLLIYGVRIEERMESLNRRFSGRELTLAKARVAAGLLPQVRTSYQKKDFTYDYCRTRSFLWGAVIDGILACGHDGWYFDLSVARSLLESRELSKNERKELLDLLRRKFDESPHAAGKATRYLLWAVNGAEGFLWDRDVVQLIVKSAARHLDLGNLDEWVRLICLEPGKSFA